MSIRALALVAFAFCGCSSSSSSSDVKGLVGTYSVQVTAFGKTDPDLLTIGQGDDVALLAFNYGFYTDPGSANGTGLRATFSGDDLTLAMQPVHVDHSTGSIDGTVTGKGTLSTTGVDLTLEVQPATGSVVEFTLAGTKQ